MSTDLSNLRRRVNRARRFPDNTCPASRHVQYVAEKLLEGKGFDADEHEHISESLLSVVESLWKARTELTKRDKT